ncbi:group II intron reverse transcriptase/maturase [Thomasclavelia cocleata]|uniref:group II intron reverse transcriptase/maturase n=1 Tax=Thomasclavelia cocleata TaxID=69824 RepID=UPI0026224049|nr:group II intron reverse transcriptase/maturase [Thomasclavelia cocleata]
MELLEKILSKENLNNAYKQVYKNKGASGVDGVTVDELFSYIKEHKEEILSLIRKRKYKPQPVRRVYIPKENGKLRKLGIPSVIDRVLQQAIVQVLTPIYEEQFSNNSFGFRPGRSCEQAVIKALECFNDGYDWIVDIDLQSFFDEVNQDKLMAIIHRTIKDDDVISLIRKFLQSGVMEKGVIQETRRGTPQGGNLSPLLSNIMLNELDKELEARGLNFVRYADDCLIMVKSEKAANRVMESITTFITKKLGLKVNAEKSKTARPNQIKYLGFGFYKKINQNIWRPKPHIKSVEKFVYKLRQILLRKRGIPLNQRLKELKYLIYGWINYFRIADMKKLLEKLDMKVRRKLRVIIWKQWKKIKKRYTSLRKLGITHKDAYVTANSRRGYYHIAHTRVLESAISKEKLNKRGLVNCLDHYLKVHIITN